jgi:hypothetical protein
MPVKLVERAPAVGCYRCGKTDIHSLCHHCGKAMCKEHSTKAFQQGSNRVHDPSGAKPVSAEYAGLNLSPVQAAVYHCKEHEHTVGAGGALTVLGIIIAVVGIIVAIFSLIPGIVIMLVGAGIAAYDIVKRRRGQATAATSAPDFPLFPHMRAARVSEYLTGRVDLDTDGYTSAVTKVFGEVAFSMTNSEWQQRLVKYRVKFHVTEGGPVTFNAGFALLQGRTGLAFAPGQPLVLEQGNGLWFRGTGTDHALFASGHGRAEGEWAPVARYELQDSRNPTEIPLWIVPSLTPSSDQRTLEVDLHWTPLLDEDGPVIEMFDLIRLEVPIECGLLDTAEPGNAATTPPSADQPFRVIDWEQVAPIADVQYKQLRQRGSRSLKLRFEDKIPASATLAGQIQATFAGTLSGATGIGLYLPGGRLAETQLLPSAKTRVTVDFRINLDAVRYQDDRVVPDENEESDKDKHQPLKYPVIPNHNVIIKLTDTISDGGYYVKSLVEHVPYRDDSRASVVNHVWDIAGRFYEGIFPIDFSVHVRGEEFQGAPGPFAGNTMVQVSVKGSYATGGNADGTLKGLIEQKWKDLRGLVEQVFQGAQAPGGLGDYPLPGGGNALGPVIEPPAIEPPSFESPAGPLGDWPPVGGPGRHPAAPPVVVPSEVIEPVVVASPSAPGGHPDKAELKADLLRQWKLADEAVMLGRISDDTYRAMVTRIKAELRNLGEDLGD